MFQEIPPANPAIAEYVRLALADATDDVAVSREVAIRYRTLSPAASPNASRLARFLQLNALLSEADFQEIDRLLAEAVACQTHFDSGAPFHSN